MGLLKLAIPISNLSYNNGDGRFLTFVVLNLTSVSYTTVFDSFSRNQLTPADLNADADAADRP